jgi:hypothetical protein
MSAAPGKKVGTVRLRRDLSERLKVASAMAGQPIEQLVSPVVEKGLPDIEKMATARFRATTQPTRSKPTG